MHRASILKDVIEEFKDPTILESTRTYNVVIIDDHGQVEAGRGTGVTREVVSLFWNQFYSSLSEEKSHPSDMTTRSRTGRLSPGF